MNRINFFNADFRDGRIYIEGKSYPSGTFAVHLLNQFYKDDTAARISIFVSENMYISNTLKIGYLNPDKLVKAGEEIQYILKILPKLKPFNVFDIDDERNRIKKLFSLANGEKLVDYFQRKAKVMLMDEGNRLLNVLPPQYDKVFFDKCDTLLDSILSALHFYDNIGEDLRNAHEKLINFIEHIDEAERFDEAHLLPIALSRFETKSFDISMNYVSVGNNTLARKMYFESYYSFIITDFFEGLHYGHYPRQCEICERYFLMTSAARQKYCNGYSPYKVKGKKISCRKYAARINRKEYALDNPAVIIYKNRCSAIRVEKSRKVITEEFAKVALSVAKNFLQKAKSDTDYFKVQYHLDMSRESIYKKTEEILKNENGI